MPKRIVCIAFGLIAVTTTTGSAQVRFDPRPSPAFALFRPTPTVPPAPAASFIHSSARDYRWEGMVVGAVAFAGLGAYLSLIGCRLSEDSNYDCFSHGVALTLLGAFGGGIIGGVLGGSIPKPPPKVPPSETH